MSFNQNPNIRTSYSPASSPTMIGMQTIGLLALPNIFMTFTVYFMKEKKTGTTVRPQSA